MSTYRCGIYTGTHGLKYERQLPQVLFVRGTRMSLRFELAMENAEAGLFDDCVFRNLEANETLFIQAKHKLPKQPITYKDLFETPNGDFDIIKYIKSYIEVEKNFEGEKRYFIFTNLPLDLSCTNASEGVRVETRKVDEVMDFTSHGGIYEGLVLQEDTIQSIVDQINSDFNRLVEYVIEVFDPSCREINSAFANLKLPLSSILTKSKKCLKFSNDAVGTSLYQALKKHYESKGQIIEEIEKNVEGVKGIDNLIKGDKRKKLPMCFDREQIDDFLKKLTFCTNQPEELLNIAREDVQLLMRSWVMPEELARFPKDGTEIPMKRFQDVYDQWFSGILALVAVNENQGNRVPYLSWEQGNDILQRLENEFSEQI